MAKRRLRKIRKKETRKKAAQPIHAEEEKEAVEEKGFAAFYEKNYKRLLIIPFVILLLAFVQIGYQLATTGDFVTRGVSLKGGVTVTVPTEDLAPEELSSMLQGSIDLSQINIRRIGTPGAQSALAVESLLEEPDMLVDLIEEKTGLDSSTYSIDVIGSSLGASFFRDIMFALGLAFVFMGVTVFLYFRTFVPSIAVILAAFSDLVTTLAITNVLEIRLSTAGIAAFLMLIGYSIDTDILLSTRLLKRKEGSLLERMLQSAKTGLTMSMSTIVAVLIVLTFSNSETLSQIMTILLIGLLVDLIYTWLQNEGILKNYLDNRR